MEGKVIDPDKEEEETKEESFEEEEMEEEVEKKATETEKPKIGDILNYTKEVDLGVATEDGRISVTENKDLVLQIILSTVIEIKQMLLQILKKKEND